MIPLSRAEVMAFRIAKVSAIRGDVTTKTVAKCEDDASASSIIQPKEKYLTHRKVLMELFNPTKKK